MSEVANSKLMVSLYQNFKTNFGNSNLIEVFQEIKSDKYQSEVNSIRYALHKGDEKKADEIKNSLNVFTMSGTYGISRTKTNISSYSDLLRKAFHSEKISISRKTNNEYFEINNPRLAVALSGTPQQVYNIISSAEDGLFSRFVFYVFKTNSHWIDPSPYGSRVNLTEHFAKLSIAVYEMVLFLDSGKTKIHLTREQWDRFNPTFSE